MRNIFCEFEISTYNTLCSRGPTEVLALSLINVPGGHPVFQNDAKNIPWQDFMIMNISCKFEKESYKMFLLRVVTANNKGGIWPHSIRYHFIALIHPIQWTIALPVGATGPAKRQKKTSCIYYRQDRSQSVHSPGGASYFISCLPLDVIASFSFGAKECAEDFLQRYAFEFLQRTPPSFLFFISTE